VWRFGTELQDSLVSGCAALEQCEGTAPLRESTDIYGFASSLFFALTGSFPKNALARKEDPRLLIPSSILQNIPPHVVTSLANALQVSAEKRTPTFERMRAELSASPTITATIEETESLRRIPSPVPPQKEERAEKNSDEGHDLKGETSQGAQPVQQPSRPPRSPQMRKNTGHKGKKKIPMFVWTIFVCAVLLIIVTVVVVVRMSSGNNKSQQAIVSQTSEAGTADSETTSAVSSTVAEQITVPNLVNKKYEDNQQSSSDADYQVVVSKHEYSDTVEAGYIISQTPTAGEKMVKGTAISVIVSDGNALITLPDLAGLTAEEAVSVLKSRGFTSVQQENGHSEYVGIGQAYGYKNQNAGDKMAANSTITILINANSSSTSSNG
jgi:serine/threonine-protein kinase